MELKVKSKTLQTGVVVYFYRCVNTHVGYMNFD